MVALQSHLRKSVGRGMNNTQPSENTFVEQAEHLGDHDFRRWFVHHPKEGEHLRKLKASGAKLVTGPRGTGKTTLMLTARQEMLRSEEVLPAYINFKTSLWLEPMYRATGNATFWFKQWLLIKTAVGLADTARDLDEEFPWAILGLQDESAAGRLIEVLQTGAIDTASAQLDSPLTNQSLNSAIRKLLETVSRNRVVLLFDDAAHAFSSEQQRDFFDFFREIKSPLIAPKAAIYPGVTDFSASFHVGHDAEEVNVWLDPNEPEYLNFMRSLIQRRLTPSEFVRLSSDPEVLHLIALGAFGIPRNMLNMVRHLLGDTAPSRSAAISRSRVQESLKECAQTSLQVFRSLQKKLPVYAKFVEAGESFLRTATATIKEYNANTTRSTATTIALPSPVPAEVRTLVAFLQYAGLVRPRGEVSRGENGVFALFDVHYALLINGNAVVAGRSVAIVELAARLARRNAHAFARSTYFKVLGKPDVADALPLMLPPCSVCETPRASPAAKFCLNCGSALKVSSTFENAVAQDIEVLPITKNRAASIKTGSNIKSVKDILLDKSHTELMRVHMVGPVWATRIFRYAEEFVE